MVKFAKLIAGFLILTGFSFYNMFSDAKIFLPTEFSIEQKNTGVVIVQLTQAPMGKLGIADLWKATLTNTSQKETYKIYLFGTLTDKKTGLVATATTMEFDLKPGTKIIKGSDFPKEPDVYYPNPDPKYKDALVQTGSLPEGDYEYCLYAKLKSTNEELGFDCKDHNVIGSEFINLITPSDGEELDIQNQVTFTWMNSKVERNPAYTLKIVEVLDKQTPEAAFERNKGWFEQSNIKTTVFQYPKSGKPFEDGKKYAWGVKTGYAMSEVGSFKANKKNPPSNCAGVQVNFIKVSDSPCCFKVSVTSTLYGTQTYFTITSDNYDISSSTHNWLQNPQNITSPIKEINWGGVLSIGTIEIATICFKPNATGSYTVKYKILDEGIFCEDKITLNCNVVSDCCTEFLSNVTSPVPIISGKNVTVRNSFLTSRKFNKVTATVVEANATATCDIPSGDIPVVCGITFAELSDFTSVINYGEAIFTSINSDGVMSADSRLFFNFSQFSNKCKWNVKLCIRWTFTDIDCKTCEKLVCYTFDINPVPIKNNENLEKDTGSSRINNKLETGGKKTPETEPLNVTITAKSGSSNITSIESGRMFTYEIRYSLLENVTNPSININIPSSIADVQNADIIKNIDFPNASFNLSTRVVSFTTSALQAGTSGFVYVNVKFPAGITPNQTLATTTAIISGTVAGNTVSITSLENNVTSTAVNKFVFDKFVKYAGTVDGISRYEIKIFNPQNSYIGGLNLTNATIEDVFEPNAIITDCTDFSNTSIAQTHNVDITNHKIVWTFAQPIPVNTSSSQIDYAATVKIKYPLPDYSENQTVVNYAKLTGLPFGSTTQFVSEKTVQHNIYNSCNLYNGKTVYIRNPIVGENGYYTLWIKNQGNVPVDNIVLSDNIPPQVNVTGISTPSYPGQFNLEYVEGNSNITYTKSNCNFGQTINVFGTPGPNCIGLNTSSEYLKSFKVSFTQIPVETLIYFYVFFTVISPDHEGNNVNIETAINNSSSVAYSGSICNGSVNSTPATFTIAEPKPVLQLTKSKTPAGPFNPDETVNFGLRIWNTGTAPLYNVIISDGLNNVLNPNIINPTISGTQPGLPNNPFNPTITGQILKWNIPVLNASKYIDINFGAKIVGVASVGNYSNVFTAIGDGYPLNSCGPIYFSVRSNSILKAEKSVKGNLDNDYSTEGRGSEGSTFYYKIKLTNLGTEPINQLKVIDIFPYIGDVGVVNYSDVRNSEWSPTLTNIVTPVNESGNVIPNVNVYYHNSVNPCRNTDLNIVDPAGCDNNPWQSSINPITLANSIKFDFGTTNILNPGQSITLIWPMYIPPGIQTGKKAFNSFGVVGKTYNGIPFLATEPNPVSIEVAGSEPVIIGNFVFADQNSNGIQDVGEPGINGVKVEIFNQDGSTVIDKFNNPVPLIYTVNNGSGNPGYYKFVSLNPGNYYLKFTPPTGYQFTSKDMGSDDEKDSDIDPLTYKTDVFTALAGEINLSYDAGLVPIPQCNCSFSAGIPVIVCKKDETNPYFTGNILINNLSNCKGTITSIASSDADITILPPNNEISANSSGNLHIRIDNNTQNPVNAILTMTMNNGLSCQQNVQFTLPFCCTCNFNVSLESLECLYGENNISYYHYQLIVENTSNCEGKITNVSTSAGTIKISSQSSHFTPAMTGFVHGDISVPTGTTSVTITLTMKLLDGTTCEKQITINLPCCCKLIINDPTINCYQQPPSKNFNPCNSYNITQPVVNASNCAGIVKIVNPNGNILATASISAGATQTFSFQLANTTGQDMTVNIILTLSDGTICEQPFTYHFPDCCVCNFDYSNFVINCVEGSPGEYIFQANIINTSNYSLLLDQTTSSSGITIITSTWYQLQMGASTLLTGKISNPTGPNISITITMKMPDNTTCQKIISFTLPECPGAPPSDCCKDFDLKITNDFSKYTGNGSIRIKDLISSTQAQITEFSATILSAELNYPTTNCGINFVYQHSDVMGTILANSTLTNFVNPNLLTPTSREIIWYNTTGTTINDNASDLKIKFLTPQFYTNCGGVLKICLKYSFVDIKCVRCEKIVCYEIPVQ